MKIPEPSNTTANAIYAAIEASSNQRPRVNLGASEIGHHCERWLWLRFRWAVSKKFSGRMLRLFRRGHDEEPNLVRDMIAAGMVVNQHDESGGQFHVRVRPHFSGSMDGIIESGVPESPNKRHVFEAKTSSKKSFGITSKQGVQQAQPTHYAQMQVYMHETGIDRALYVVVCKDDDQIYSERVRLDKLFFEKLKAKAERIITTDRMLEPVSGNPTWFQCKFCAAHSICHKAEPVREVNCRTCAHVTFADDGVRCERWDSIIPRETQYEGCRSHVIHPDMVPWSHVGGDGANATYKINGKTVINGEDGEDSRSLLDVT